MSIVHVTSENYAREVLESDKTVLLDFFAVWCGPCKMIAPYLEEIAQEREDVKVCKIDVDQAMDIAAQFRVVSIPTLVVLRKGKVIAQSVGAMPKNEILELLER